MFHSLLQLEKSWGRALMSSAGVMHSPLGQKKAGKATDSVGDVGRPGDFIKAKAPGGRISYSWWRGGAEQRNQADLTLSY